jgi:hypothetical protein
MKMPEQKWKFRWVQKRESAESLVTDCYIMPKDGEMLFYEVELNGVPQLIPNLRGYAIIPRSEYERLRGSGSRLHYNKDVESHNPDDVLPK